MPRSFLLKRSSHFDNEKTQNKGRTYGASKSGSVNRSLGSQLAKQSRAETMGYWPGRPKSAVHNGKLDYFASYTYQSFIDGDLMKKNILHDESGIPEESKRILQQQNALVFENKSPEPNLVAHSLAIEEMTGQRKDILERKVSEVGQSWNASTVSNTATTTTGTGAKPVYKCEQCGKTFKTKYTLTIHLKMPNHTGARPFVCNICGKGFRLSSTLCRHKIIHTSEKPHQCHICQKAFNRSSTLKTHIRTHSEKKEFVCDVCGKGFHQKGNLRNHFLIHTGEKPYRCRLCNKAFNKLSNLKFHLHVHTDNTPYRCRHCKTAFSRRCDLKQHTQACHHKDESDVSGYFDGEEL